jgi:hypothetical protein
VGGAQRKHSEMEVPNDKDDPEWNRSDPLYCWETWTERMEAAVNRLVPLLGPVEIKLKFRRELFDEYADNVPPVAVLVGESANLTHIVPYD